MKKIIYMTIISLIYCSLQLQAQCFNLYIQTPNNSNVKACYSGGYSSSQVANADAYSRTFAIQVFEAGTNSYNCHGYAWHKKAGGNNVWINNVGNELNNLNVYWTDNSYYNYAYNSQNHADNLKVFYGNDDHTAVTTSNPDVFISKMGCGCLVSHHKDNSPYTEGNFTYYKRSPNFTLSGPEVVGSTCASTFTLNNLSSGLSASWTVSPALSIVSSTANSVSVMKNSAGDTDLSAGVRASFSSSGSSFSVQKPVIAWRSGIQNSSVSETLMQYGVDTYGGEFALYSPFGGYATALGSNFNWTTNADWQALHQGSCFTVFDGNLFCGAPLYITVYFTDVCGGLSTIYRSFYVDCPAYSFVSVYPNPNNGIFTLKRIQPANATATPLNQSATPVQKKSQEQLTVRIYASSTAALAKEMQIVLSDETTINTGGLPKGKYIVQVVRDNTVIYSSQMMIEGNF